MKQRVLTWGSGWGDNRLLLNGQQIGEFDETMMRERATARFDGQEWAFTKAFGGDILATRAGEGSSEPDQPSMAAAKHGALFPRWEVETAAGVYFLRGSGRSLGWVRGGPCCAQLRDAALVRRRVPHALGAITEFPAHP